MLLSLLSFVARCLNKETANGRVFCKKKKNQKNLHLYTIGILLLCYYVGRRRTKIQLVSPRYALRWCTTRAAAPPEAIRKLGRGQHSHKNNVKNGHRCPSTTCTRTPTHTHIPSTYSTLRRGGFSRRPRAVGYIMT